MEDSFATFTLLISRISRLIKRLKSEEMAAYGLKGTQVTCLYYLYLFRPLTASELCERCDEDKSAISRALSDLEKKGLVCAESQSAKKYRTPVSLTDAGIEMGQMVFEKVNHFVEEASRDLSEEDRKVLYRCLYAIDDRLENCVR